jgi:hypothetical protein
MQIRLNLGFHKIGGGLEHHALFFAKIFPNKDFFGERMVDQKMAPAA